MIKECNNSVLASKEIDEKYYLFYQVWKELTAKKSLDSYQYRIMNTLNVIEELVDVIENRLNGNHNSNRNIEDCRLEALSIIRRDEVLRKHYKLVYNRLLANLSKKPDSEPQQKVLRRQLIYWHNLISVDYLQKLFEELEESISYNNQDEIIAKASSLISICASQGWSDDALFSAIDLIHGSKVETQKWESFKLMLVSRSLGLFRVLIPIKVSPTKSSQDIFAEIEAFGVSVIKGSEVLEKYKYVSEVQAKSSYIELDVEAHDPYSASHIALNRHADILNSLSFYSIIEPWDFNRINWTVIDETTESYKKITVKKLYSTYDYLDGARKIFESSKRLTSTPGSGTAADVKKRLKATYSYANMGKVSYKQEEKFMNLWVALESLCRTDAYTTISDNIMEMVPPALCQRYIYRLVRNYYEDCKRCDVLLDDLGVIDGGSKALLVEKMILIFKDKTSFKALKSKVQINDLLLNRTNRMQEMLCDIEKINSAINSHYLNVRLQLSRLYRMRNQIAHSAYNEESSLIRYIEHLADYLSSFVAEVVMCADYNNEFEMGTVLDIIKENYLAFSEVASANKQVEKESLLAPVLTKGIIQMIP